MELGVEVEGRDGRGALASVHTVDARGNKEVVWNVASRRFRGTQRAADEARRDDKQRIR